MPSYSHLPGLLLFIAGQSKLFRDPGSFPIRSSASKSSHGAPHLSGQLQLHPFRRALDRPAMAGRVLHGRHPKDSRTGRPSRCDGVPDRPAFLEPGTADRALRDEPGPGLAHPGFVPCGQQSPLCTSVPILSQSFSWPSLFGSSATSNRDGQ